MKKNDSSNTPNESLGVWNTPELEARLVAMLMGELSPFEEAEMEQELERSPELRLFRDRMIEVQGLITAVNRQVEDESNSGNEADDDDWSLSPERKSALLENFAEEKVPDSPAGIISKTSIQWRNVFSIAACLLISLAAFMVLFVRKSTLYKNSEEMVTYSAMSESEEAIIQSLNAEDRTVRSVNPSTAEKSEKKKRGLTMLGDSFYANEDDFFSEGIITKPKMSNEVEKEPSNPSSSMAKVIAANTPSSTAVPVPNLTVTEPSLDFGDGDGDDFGDGFGTGSANGVAGGEGRKAEGKLALLDSLKQNQRYAQDDPFGESEQQALAYGQEIPMIDPADKTIDFQGKRYSLMDNNLEGLKPYESRSLGGFKKDLSRIMNEADLRMPAEGFINDDKILSLTKVFNSNSTDSKAWKATLKDTDKYAWWVGYASKKANPVTAGNRSGDFAISRDSIDSFLNNPNRSAPSSEGGLVQMELANMKADSIDSATLKKRANEELADARRKVKLFKLMLNNPATKEYSAELFGPEIGEIDEKALKEAEENLTLAEKKSEFAKDFETRLIVGDRTLEAMDLAKSGKVDKLKDLRKNQEDKVEDHKTRLYALSKKLQIPYHGKDSRYYAGRDSDANQHDRSNQAYEEAKRSKNQLESFVNSLSGLSDEDLKVTLLASGRPEAVVLKADYDQLRELMLNKSAKLAGGSGYKDKTIKSIDDKIKGIDGRLDRSTINVRKKLAKDLVVFNQIVEKLRLNSSKEEAEDLMVSAEGKTMFGKVREDYERELAILDAIKQAEFSETIGENLERHVIQEKSSPDFTKEISAAQQTHSTFSLNVSDVSYKLAKSVLLEKGVMPEADKIRVEEFVNAFDYGDPSASGKKVSCVVEQCAHPFYQQRNLMRIGMKTGAMGRSQPLRLTVLLDNSGSMEREDRAATVVKAVEALASQLGPQDEVTLLSFARGARLVAQKVKGDQAHKLVNLVRSIPSEGGTNLSLAIEQAYTTAQQSIQEGTMSRIVLITDGAANLGNADPEDLSKSIEKMRQNGIAFDACGVGADGLDDDMLEALTRKGDGRYYFINRPEDADAGFAQKLAGALRPAAKNVKVQVVFNPERVGNYRLIGFEKHRLKKQDFRNDTVDAAEMAAEEAGNALYQVEARPDGEGDVGTVFVRFRDMATGQMVERSWAIPYQPNINSLSSADPSMQLATVAGMLGERLKQGEEAGIDIKQLKPIYGMLRSHFHADNEVKDLIRMCEKVISER